jgi:hypothetical protein
VTVEEVIRVLRPFVENGSGPDRPSRGFTFTAGQHVVWITREQWEAAVRVLALADVNGRNRP